MPRTKGNFKAKILLSLSFVLLFFTLPFLDATPYFGIPLWVYLSLGFTLLYVLILLFLIEKNWEYLRGYDE